jgi:hypothetical protein
MQKAASCLLLGALAAPAASAVIGIDFGARFLKVRRRPHRLDDDARAAPRRTGRSSSARGRSALAAARGPARLHTAAWPPECRARRQTRHQPACRMRAPAAARASIAAAPPRPSQVGIIQPGTGIELVLNEATQRKSSSTAGFNSQVRCAPPAARTRSAHARTGRARARSGAGRLPLRSPACHLVACGRLHERRA